MVKNQPSIAGDTGSIPGQGTKSPHAMGQLSPHAATTEPTRPVACAPQLERSPHRTERSCVPQLRLNTAKKIKTTNKYLKKKKKTTQIILGGFAWLLMNWHMLLILLSCYLFKESILSLKILNNYLLWTVCIVKTIGENIFEEIERTLIQYNLKENLLRCVPNDGGKNICS